MREEKEEEGRKLHEIVPLSEGPPPQITERRKRKKKKKEEKRGGRRGGGKPGMMRGKWKEAA